MTKTRTQSQEIISDTPDERNLKHISPRKQNRIDDIKQKNDELAEDCVPPTPPKAERRLNSTFHFQHNDEESLKVPPEKKCLPLTQTSSSEQNSESLIQPKTEVANEEPSETHIDTKPSLEPSVKDEFKTGKLFVG